MKIRRCANLLLGVVVSVSATPQFDLPASPQFEQPPSARFELPPPAQEFQAGFASKTSSSLPEPCVTSFFPWDLMGQLDLSDPQEEERFMETYSVPVARRASWLFPARVSAGFLKQDNKEEEMIVDHVHDVKDDEEEDIAVEMVNMSILEPYVSKEVGRTAREKDSKVKTKNHKKNADKSHESGEEVHTCKKNDSKNWFCRRPVSQPNTLCPYHSDPKLPGSLKQPRRKRVASFDSAADEGFYYYTGFGPSGSKRHRELSSRSVPEPAPYEEKVEARFPEANIDVTRGRDQADGVGDELRCDDDDMAGIAGYVEDISSDDDVKRKSLVQRRKRKPVNTRSINSLVM